jgi:hypothetical protein
MSGKAHQSSVRGEVPDSRNERVIAISDSDGSRWVYPSSAPCDLRDSGTQRKWCVRALASVAFGLFIRLGIVGLAIGVIFAFSSASPWEDSGLEERD